MTDVDNDNNEKEPEEMIPYYFSNQNEINKKILGGTWSLVVACYPSIILL